MINLTTENLIIIILLAVLIAWTIVLQIWLAKVQKKMKIFLKGKKVKDLEEVISGQLKRIKGVEVNIKKLSEWNKELQEIVDISITKIGLVRFNPFNDTGGDQSFVIALLDSNNNGLVLSSLYARDGNRVFTKPIEKGKSVYNLSKEEERAIVEAME